MRTRAIKTHCPKGHELTPENTYVTGTGYRSCRTCIRDSGARYRGSPKGQARSARYFKQINARPDRRAKRDEWLKKSASTPGGKVRRQARIQVMLALRKGDLARKPCEVCGSTTAHAHHDDYSKPLAVRWLCRAHHRAWHRENKPKMPEAA